MAFDSADVVDIGKGEPDFHSPPHAKEAGRAAIETNFTKYTPQPGIPELREAVARKFESDNGFCASPDEIVVSCGGKHSVDNVIRCLMRPGVEAVVFAPNWFAYPRQVELAGGACVFVPTREEDGFLPDAAEVRAAITPKTRLLIVNSPCNPTGAVYPPELLEALAQIAVEHDLWVIADEVYEKIVFDGARHVSIASLNAAIAKRTITVNSVSKTHAMTGWRIGYAAMPRDLARRVAEVQGLSTSAPSAVSQRAALAALTGDQSHVAEMVAAYAARREYVLERVGGIPQLSACPPTGTFYCFVNIEPFLGKTFRGTAVRDADGFRDLLLSEVGVRVVSGVESRSERHVRISFAVAQEALEEGFDRLEAFAADF